MSIDRASDVGKSDNISVIEVELEDEDNFDGIRCSINQVQADSKQGK